MIKSETITKIAPALLKAQQSMGDATKGSANPFFKSSYADLNAIREAALPALNANGIVVLQPNVVQDGKNYVQTLLLHESGEFIAGLTEIKVSKQNDAQAEGSGISYARRYGLQSLLNIGAKDDDGEGAIGRGTVANKANTTTVTANNTAVASNATAGNSQQNAGTTNTVAVTPLPKKTYRKTPAKTADVVATGNGSSDFDTI